MEGRVERSMLRLPHVLHVSGDFPDPFCAAKTPVISTLLALTKDRFDHSVISINRMNPGVIETLSAPLRPGQLRIEVERFPQGDALCYFAPPLGLMHASSLKQLGEWTAARIANMPRRPDLLVGHKLTIEGIAVARAAALLGLPYALSIQGDTDTKILAARPDLGGLFREVLHKASLVFPFTDWAWQKVIERLGPPSHPRILLPCPTDLDEPLAPISDGNGFVSVFHLRNFRRKNLAGMVRALEGRNLDGDYPTLTIIGGGSREERAACERLVRRRGRVELAGPLGRADIRARLNQATAFVLPSLRESFGLVFVEALFAGTPVIYPTGTAIDGYFNDLPFAIPVDARDPQAILMAMLHARQNETQLKVELANWQSSDHAKQFQRPEIADRFTRGLNIAIEDGVQATYQ